MKKVKHFLIRLEGEKLWFRNEFRLSDDTLSDFVVQLEITESNERLTPVRYDIAHDYFHRDIMDENTRNVEKTPLAGNTQEDQITNAINDLITNWEYILKKGGYLKLATNINIIPTNSLNAARDYLVDLVKNPSKIETAPNIVELHPKTEAMGIYDVCIHKLVKGIDQENQPK